MKLANELTWLGYTVVVVCWGVLAYLAVLTWIEAWQKWCDGADTETRRLTVRLIQMGVIK